MTEIHMEIIVSTIHIFIVTRNYAITLRLRAMTEMDINHADAAISHTMMHRNHLCIHRYMCACTQTHGHTHTSMHTHNSHSHTQMHTHILYKHT